MSILSIFINKRNPNNWRPEERESMESVFGPITETDIMELSMHPEFAGKFEYVHWCLNAEKTTDYMWELACGISNTYVTGHEINSPFGWPGVHAKNMAFKAWSRVGVPHPRYLTFNDHDEIESAVSRWPSSAYPALARLNDGNTGEASYVVANKTEFRESAIKLLTQDRVWLEAKYGQSGFRRGMLVEFIDGRIDGMRYSYRIIVAGNKVVTGYARMAKPPDWVAITDRFRYAYGETWKQMMLNCEAFCKEHEKLIVKSVHSLGLNWQGVDVIFDNGGNPYFLEVQPQFSCGNPRSGDRPPWYNPSYPQLVQYLCSNQDWFERNTPNYVNYWLDKKGLFNSCHKALKEMFDG